MYKILYIVVSFALTACLAWNAQAQTMPEAMSVHIEADASVLGVCRTGWRLGIWDARSQLHASVRGAALDARLAHWNGTMALVAVCGRTGYRWSPFAHTLQAAGLRSFRINGRERADEARPLSLQSRGPFYLQAAIQAATVATLARR